MIYVEEVVAELCMRFCNWILYVGSLYTIDGDGDDDGCCNLFRYVQMKMFGILLLDLTEGDMDERMNK